MSGSNSSSPAAGASAPDEPLALTVHSLPALDGEEAARAAGTRKGRFKMLAVLLVCAAPVIASYFTYYVVRPDGRKNYGELVEQRPLPALQGVDLAGRTVPLESLKDQWLLVSVAASACDAACERHLYLQRQLREGLGRDKDRLDWVWLRTDDAPVSDTLRKATEHATVLRVEREALAQWLSPAPGQRLEDHLYVVDPLGHWMMRFPADADPTKVRRDLTQLLRASAGWDKEGRP